MDKKNTTFNSILWLLRVLVVFYGLLAFYYWIVKVPPGSGDEGLMALYLDEAKDVGFFNYLGRGNISIPHFLIIYLPSLFLPSYIVLRIVTLLFSFLIYIYFVKRFPIDYPEFKFHLLFYLFSGSFFLGTNDTMMIFFLLVFFLECYRVIAGLDTKLSIFAPIALLTALFTREMTIIYFPIIMLSIFILWNKINFSIKKAVATIGILIFWIVLNVPSIIQNQKISFDNKIQEKQMGVSWEQLKYLSQLKANEGELPENQFLKWIDAREYLDLYGENSLPKSTLEAIMFNPELTVKESLKDFKSILIAGLRQISLAITFPFLLLFMVLLKRPISKPLLYLGSSVLIMMIIFSIIIISYVEIRWLATAFLLAIMGMYLIIQEFDRNIRYRLFNLLVLILLNAYGIFTYYNRVFH